MMKHELNKRGEQFSDNTSHIKVASGKENSFCDLCYREMPKTYYYGWHR